MYLKGKQIKTTKLFSSNLSENRQTDSVPGVRSVEPPREHRNESWIHLLYKVHIFNFDVHIFNWTKYWTINRREENFKPDLVHI